MPNEIKGKLEEGINLISAGTYLNFRDAKYKAKASQKGLIDSLITKLSGEISELDSSIKKTKGKMEQTIVPSEIRQSLLVYGSIALFSGIIVLFYGHTPMDRLGENMNTFIFISIFGFVISCPLFLYSLIRSIPFWYKKKSNDGKLRTLEQIISGKRDIMATIESNKSNLNIDRDGESLNYIDYEKYLRKTYG